MGFRARKAALWVGGSGGVNLPFGRAQRLEDMSRHSGFATCGPFHYLDRYGC